MKNIRDVGVHTSDTLSKAGSFTCAAMQHMLSSLAVPRRVWHAAHALVRHKNVLSNLWNKNQVVFLGEPRTFFSDA